MSDKNQYQAILRSKVRSAIEQAKAASVLTHQGVKGNIVEILVGGIFRPLLPSDIGVGTGQIIDCYGSPMSGQTDIVLYDKSILPPILIDDKTGLFPVESVLYAIEVKTTLDNAGLSTAHSSAEKLAKFGYLPGMKDELGKEKKHPVKKLRSVVFALNSDLTGTNLNEATRYKKLYGDGIAHLRAICVAGREYWFDNGEHWIGFKHIDEYDEVLAFIGGVTNTYRGVSESRHHPLLGNYVVPEANVFSSIESRKIVKLQVKCDKCGIEALFKPNFGKMNIIVNGAISNKEPCANCGGIFRSLPGEYKFVNGELVEGNG